MLLPVQQSLQAEEHITILYSLFDIAHQECFLGAQAFSAFACLPANADTLLLSVGLCLLVGKPEGWQQWKD